MRTLHRQNPEAELVISTLSFKVEVELVPRKTSIPGSLPYRRFCCNAIHVLCKIIPVMS